MVPPEQNPAQKELWDETWKRLDRFLPGLRNEVFPDEAGKKPRRSGSGRQKQRRQDGQPKPDNTEAAGEDINVQA